MLLTPKTPRPPAAKLLEKSLANHRGVLTVADAAAKTGLPLRDAEEALRYLAAEFRGHLAATEKGELLYSFPQGLTRPPETRLWRRAVNAIGRGIAGIGRFVVRAWVSVVLIGYALIFLGVLLALALKSDSDDGAGHAIGLVFRVIAEALYWTFHPFSPIYVSYDQRHYLRDRHANNEAKVPFYEKVNRFVFGPRPPERDPLEDERNVLAEIRRQAGRVSPADVMRVTGLTREATETLLLRLMVDYHGEVEVTEDGVLVYRFTDLRSTAEVEARLAAMRVPAPPPFWNSRAVLRPLTGNSAGSNVLFTLINGFNVAASSYVLANGLTLERIAQILSQYGEQYPQPIPPPDGIPLFLGLVPFVFSTALFLLPLARAARQPAEKARVARENGWRGVLRQIINGRDGSVVQTRAELEAAWMSTTGGQRPSEPELTAAVRAAGGELDIGEDGQLIYKFDTVEAEQRAAALMRQAASSAEAHPGQVVFDSATPGTGERRQATASPSNPRSATAAAARSAYAQQTQSQAASPPPPSAPRPPAALPAPGETIPDPSNTRRESAEELLARIGVDTRRRGG